MRQQWAPPRGNAGGGAPWRSDNGNGPGGHAEIVVGARTLAIGSQIYQLANVVRIQSFEFRPDTYRDLLAVLVRLVIWALAWVGYGLVLAAADDAGVDVPAPVSFERLQVGGVVAILVVVAVQAYRMVRIARRRASFAFLLETTGDPYLSVVSRDRYAIAQLAALITDALENPPNSQVVHWIENLNFGNQVNQQGSGNKIEGVFQK